jgi:hypothetical protein
MAKVNNAGVPSLKATDFGPGPSARMFYNGGSIFSFVIVLAPSRLYTPTVDFLLLMVIAVSVALIIMLVSRYAGRAIARRHNQIEQGKRDMRAKNILTAAQRHCAPDFSLYLRAFETTGRMPYEASGEMFQQPGFDPRDEDDRLKDFETELAEAVEKRIPLIALGRPSEQVGAGRALSTEELSGQCRMR